MDTLTARSKIEFEPEYSQIAAQLLLRSLDIPEFVSYEQFMPHYIELGINAELLDPRLKLFDIPLLSKRICGDRDALFTYLGMQTLVDRYLLRVDDKIIEPPQLLWMRVAMGLSINEHEKNEKALEFYTLISQFKFCPATPTLFNCGTLHPQLSSCYLTTVEDNLQHIFKCVQDNALLSKWAGGLGNDWTQVRALGARIKGTNGTSQGVIPFLKVVNDTAVAVNQGGKRKGATCVYLENWHMDVEDFLDLCKNTGDERRRTHDLHTALWISDEFMRRVELKQDWTLFSPDEVTDLHDLYGQAFSERYREYERLADLGKIRLWKRMPALDLWRKSLTRLYETGHPWITFKDTANIRSTQDHVGIVHSSNLCTEILLNTSSDETAVCNLGSINLHAHISDGDIDQELLQSTINTAVRMLDNVIDINFYPTIEARRSNFHHRPIGLGVMGFQDALYELGISYASDEAVAFADKSQELIAYYAILASTALSSERGSYPSYIDSKWHRGLLPIDTLILLEEDRCARLPIDQSATLDWSKVRREVQKHGMRNSNVMAIAPTATISNIIGVSQSIEPMHSNLFVKSNLSGEFTQVNDYLIEDLRALDLWTPEMLELLKYYDGSIQEIENIPQKIKTKYLTAFEIDSKWLIECASRRQKWIDQGVSLNLYQVEPSGKALHEMYLYAWHKGLKTTYYLRSKAATQIEKSTINVNKHGIQPRWMINKSASSEIACSGPTCEVCS